MHTATMKQAVRECFLILKIEQTAYKSIPRIDDLPFGNGFATPYIGIFLYSRTAWKDLTPLMTPLIR